MDLIGLPKEFFKCADNLTEPVWAIEGNIVANLFTSALSGMNAAQLGVATTQHNIANISTPGFTRQQILVSSRAGQQTGAGFIGQGVDVTGVIRIYDQFLNTQVLQEQNQASYLTAYHSAIAQIDLLIADPAAGAAPAMQSFFDKMNAVASAPTSSTARADLLSSAQTVVDRFQAIDQSLTDMANGLTSQITGSVNTVNSYAQQIAVLNGNIKRAIASGQGQQPNDLIDQRDQAISQLNQEIKTTVLRQADGTASVFVGNGQALVLDEQAMRLQVVQSANDPSKVDIAYLNNGRSVVLQQSSLQGGKMGAYLTFRDQTLEPARNALGRVALGMAVSVNQQNQLGQEPPPTGALGGNLFNMAVPRVDQNANNNPASGKPSVTIANLAGLTTSDYRLTFNGAGYTLLRLSDNTTTSYASLPQTVDGMTITAPAPVTAGDSFLIRPTANGARDIALVTNDSNKVAAAAPIRTTKTGAGTISSGTVNPPPPAIPNPAHPMTHLNLQDTVTITFTSSTTFTVAGANPAVGVQTYVSGQNISYNGWTVQITGTPATSDVFTIASNVGGTDGRNASLLAGLQTQNLMANGTASLQGVYGQLVGEVAVKTSELAVTSLAQDNMVAQTVAAQQAVSGVNLDEEGANLIRYQNAYQAAAKAMQIAQTMFDAILAINP
jgi:flagellar hook-associated protein 1 FlgK